MEYCAKCNKKFGIMNSKQSIWGIELCISCWQGIIKAFQEIETAGDDVILDSQYNEVLQFINSCNLDENFKTSRIEKLKAKCDLDRKAKREQQQAEKQARIEKAYSERTTGVEIEDIISVNNLYEYCVEKIYDKSTGGTDERLLEDMLNAYAKNGWRVKNMFTNELGVNRSSTSMSYGGFGTSSGTNATIDEVVIIFERCISKTIK